VPPWFIFCSLTSQLDQTNKQRCSRLLMSETQQRKTNPSECADKRCPATQQRQITLRAVVRVDLRQPCCHRQRMWGSSFPVFKETLHVTLARSPGCSSAQGNALVNSWHPLTTQSQYSTRLLFKPLTYSLPLLKISRSFFILKRTGYFPNII
jgi:hypothetical protein